MLKASLQLRLGQQLTAVQVAQIVLVVAGVARLHGAHRSFPPGEQHLEPAVHHGVGRALGPEELRQPAGVAGGHRVHPGSAWERRRLAG